MKKAVALSVAWVAAAAACGGPAVRVDESVTADDFLAAEGFDWVRRDVDPFRVHTDRGTWPDLHFDRVRAAIEDVPGRVEEIFGRPLPPDSVLVFVLDSRDAMDRLVGWRGWALTIHVAPPVVLGIVTDEATSLNEHEFLHVATRRFFGPSTGFGAYALNEGVAVFASGGWRGHDLHALTKHLRREGHGLELAELLAASGLPEGVLYPQAGSFVRFLHERHGPRALAELYERQYGNPEPQLEAVLGESPARLEAGWDAAVEAADAEGIEYQP